MSESSESAPQIAGIILAAGAASRMGQPKLLLPWQGEALIHHAANTALQSGLHPVVVVTGSGAEGIKAALQDLQVNLVNNPDWASGQSTSVRAGMQTLPRAVEAVVFLLGDQPYVTPELIGQLVQAYLRDRPTILAPFVNGKRSNPVIFGRSVFGQLSQLSGDAGARSIFNQYPPDIFPWDDERILLDVDTPEDYQNLLSKK